MVKLVLITVVSVTLMMPVIVLVFGMVLAIVTLVVLIVVMTIVLVSDLLCLGVVTDTLVVKVLTGDFRAGVLMALSNVAVSLLMTVNVNICAGEMTEIGFAMPGALK